MSQLPAEMMQERRSRTAFTHCIETHGWITDPIATDIGEDMLVRVMNGKEFSGITFFAQLKSRNAIPSKARAHNEYSQKIEVAHLVHWEGSAVPVVIVVWDIDAVQGYWLTVEEAIRVLTKAHPQFRQQKTVQVKIPFANATTVAGLKRLRFDLAAICLPAVQRGRGIPLTMAFSFPATAQGRRQERALNEALAEGKTARIDGKFIKKFQHTGWAGRLFGAQDPPSEIVITPSNQAPKITLPLRLEAVDSRGTVVSAIPYVELVSTRSGYERLTLSNEHQHGTFMMKLSVPRKAPGTIDVQYTVRAVRTSVTDVHNAVAFGESLRTSSKLRMVDLRGGKSGEYPIVPGKTLSPNVVAAIERLSFIQDRIKAHGTIYLSRGVRLSRDDQREIGRLHSICSTGRFSFDGTISMVFERAGLHDLIARLETSLAGAQSTEFAVKTTKDGEPLKVFNVTVPTTVVHRNFTCQLGRSHLLHLRRRLAAAQGPRVEITLRDARVEEIYPDFEAASSSLT